MTPGQLAEEIAGPVRLALEGAKEQILAEVPPLKRALLRAAWVPAMRYGVPVEIRAVIELLIERYRTDYEPVVGALLAAAKPLIDDKDPKWSRFRELIELVETPRESFLPAVRDSPGGPS